MAKTKHGQYAEKKVPTGMGLTPTGRSGLERLAQSRGISVSELVERVGRGIYQLNEVEWASELEVLGESTAN